MTWLRRIWERFFGTSTVTTTRIPIDFSTSSKELKIALCVGINNYPNPSNNLAGCVNDANDFADYLKNTLKFDEVVILLNHEATWQKVVDNIEYCLAKKPDVFVMTNSSHGTRIPDSSGQEEDGYCEALCLYDKFLVDHDFKKILAKADAKTRITVVSDSCHSAGVTREFLNAMNDSSYVSIPKYLPHPDNVEAMKATMAPTVKAVFQPREKMSEVLMAGCQSHQYSYDASFDSKPNGAFTYYTLKLLKANPSITYGDFVTKMTEFLPCSRYPQCPIVESDVSMKDRKVFG